jgi:serine/threonine-protein kinase
MATVHLARAVGAGGFERLVAIKVMHPGLSEDPDFSAMFLDEARVAARIRHPNVVGTVDVQEGDEGLFLVMEYVEGPSLSAINRALHKKDRRMPIGIALRIMVDALLGLHAAHQQTGPSGEPLNIVHRDVSPQNILVGIDGQTKITDFGVARAEARLSSTRRGEVKGKLAYMSPQQVRTDPLDGRADSYAAGVVLWELLTGQRLFTGDNDGALVLNVMQGALRTPREVDERIPAPIDRECMRALRIEVDERHPTALAFAEALELAAEEAGVAIATPRVLAAFVKELGAHKPLAVPPVQDAPPPSTESPSRRTAAAAQVEAPPAAPAPAPAEARPAEPEANSQVASVVSAPRAPAASRARIGLAVAGVAVVIGGAAMGSRLLGSAPPAPASAAPAATVSTAAPVDNTRAALRADAPAASTAAPAEPPASAAATATASAAPSAAPTAAPSSSARPRVAPRPGATAKGPRGGNATDWKPGGL